MGKAAGRTGVNKGHALADYAYDLGSVTIFRVRRYSCSITIFLQTEFSVGTGFCI